MLTLLKDFYLIDILFLMLDNKGKTLLFGALLCKPTKEGIGGILTKQNVALIMHYLAPSFISPSSTLGCVATCCVEFILSYVSFR